MALQPCEGMPPRQCAVCHSRTKLSRCAGCQVVYYCGRDHQVRHRKAHKSDCNQIKEYRERYLQEENALRNGAESERGWTWDMAVGRFWGIQETRPYMQARFGYIGTLMSINTVDGIEMALNHQLDMLRLCRGDNMGIRSYPPHLMIRLRRDQEAYDFVKWWAVTAENSHYDWGSMELPHMNLKGEDAFEGVSKFAKRFGSLSHKMAVTLLKVRLYLDLRDLRNVDRAFKDVLPQEVTDSIKWHVVRTDVVGARRDLIEKTNTAAATGRLLEALKEQITTMVRNVKESNSHMWPGMFNPRTLLPELPDMFTMGSLEETTLTWAECAKGWTETPGSLAVVKAAGAA
ncbi:MYND finger [Colletotrichum graminicola]|uniref:MYND finger n=1 Tax=Colletotrichum graminicola (strain M1.001 / M2 / FGSC 10212) TaxID=645133 RepID=E3QWG6_COLGM|nr:MYND finger [Colletotrichum graminicola M1.001]EFQ35204.1 MYND finger [Colletotrichum graminicola M1.001]WDK09994.1 MYND finger [Colletotrichum graminicola]